MTVDNGKQFEAEPFQRFCHSIGTDLHFASVRHPESNGAVERMNGEILQGISKRLVGLKKGKWVDEMPKVIWSHNTKDSRATGFTPFRLLFGEEEALKGSIRTKTAEGDGSDRKVVANTFEGTRLEALNNI